MEWTWDPNKNRENFRKHGISFEIAQLVFGDERFVIEEDFYPLEQRWRTTGRVELEILLVVHTLPPSMDEPARIISARKATLGERIRYAEGHG